MTEEEFLLQRIVELRRAYKAEAKPFVDRLVYLRSIKPNPPWVLHLASGQPVLAETLSVQHPRAR